MEDYYKILEVSRAANSDEIKKAYRKLAKKYHPDSNPGDKAAETKFKKISEAYETLSDENKKTDYDRKTGGSSNSDTYTQTNTQNKASSNSPHSRKNFDPKDFARSGDVFENFFGFNPKTKEGNLNKNNDNIKAMKTKDAFDAVFNRNKK